MSALLCLSPALLDHSFPKDDNELWVVLDALGEIQQHLERADFGLVMTEYLRSIAEDFDYSRYHECSLLREVRYLIQQWVLQSHEGIEEIDVSDARDYQPHPVPRGFEDKGLIEVWQDEVGRILLAHDTVCRRNEFFVGMACDSAFAGGELGEYNNPGKRRAFPLTGPDNITSLSDAYEWDVPHEIHWKQVSISDFYRNYRYIGAISISSPSGHGGSHCPVKFKSARTWPLDVHYDPIPRDHLTTLSRTTGYPVDVLKDSLINGRYPRKICRLHQYQA